MAKIRNKRKNKKAIKKVTESVKIENAPVNEQENGKPMKEFYVKESILSELRKGSIESFTERVKTLATENIRKIVGETIQSNIHPLYTFKEHAIVSDDFSNLYRLHYEDTSDGLRLSKVEELSKIKRYAKEEVEKELLAHLTGSLCNAIAKTDIECENKLKESLSRVIGFRTSTATEGYVNLKRNDNI